MALWPHLLPDGRHLLLLSGSGIQRGALDSEALTPVSDVRSMAVYAPSGHLLYARDVRCSRTPSTSVPEGWSASRVSSATVCSISCLPAVRRSPRLPQELWCFGATRRYPTDSLDRMRRSRAAAVAPDAAWVFSPRVSPDGKQVAVSRRAQRQVLPTCGYSIW